jgi:dihydrofolate reductase
MTVSIIAAVGKNLALGLNNQLPWHLRTDFKHFKELTIGHTIITGRITYESFQIRPLPDRTNIVVTSNLNYPSVGILVAHDLTNALALVPKSETEAFVVGGAGLFAQVLPLVSRMYLTEVAYTGPADVYFPQINPDEWNITTSPTPPQTDQDDFPFNFVIYSRKSNIN